MKWLRERLQEHKDQLEYYCESYGPSVSGILLALIGFVFFSNFTLDCDDLDKIFNLVITLTAITIGFIGVLLGIIATIKERPIIKTFWIINKGNSRKTLEKHFMQSLRFGLGLIVYSIVLIIILKASCVTSANKILVLKINLLMMKEKESCRKNIKNSRFPSTHVCGCFSHVLKQT
ncbi:hypothetical protein [Phascolarctobacterium faecium]|uniref:hypothetical protein n=1 Tax=Phascolarctobacterium faecium TaxID=33025 RepID=UPI003FEF5568